MSYTYINTLQNGDTLADCAPHARVVKSVNASASKRDTAANALDDAFTQAYNNGYIRGYRVSIYNGDDLNFDCSSGLLKQFETWRQNNGLTGTGVWEAINACSSDSVSLGAQDGTNGWSNDSDAQATTDRPNNAVFKATVIMEVFHGYALHSCDYVANMIEESEHDLGTVLEQNGVRNHTPMVGRSISAERGTCSVNDGTKEGETTTLTSCTQKAIEYSANHTFSGHLEDAC